MRRAVRAVLTAVTIGAGLVPAATAANAFAASTATAPPGYQRVRSTPIPIPPGLFDSGGQVACPAGTVPWGGGVGFTGGIASAGENINTSAPTGNGWEGRFNNSSTRPDDNFAVDAICAKKPAGYTTTFTTVDNPAGAQSAAVAVCPAGTRLLSGGTLSTADTTDVQLLSAWPLGPERFRSVMWNGSATDQRLTTFAICGHRPAGYTITSAPESDTGGPVTLVGGAQCPAGTSILGGGIHVTSPQPAVTLGESLDKPATQWLSEVVNSATAPATVTIYAIYAA
jgi:hypothetical protein